MSDEHFSFFDAAKAAAVSAFKNGGSRVISCTQEHFDYCLNVLPPIYGPGFYGVGEPTAHVTENGKTVATRHWFAQRGSRYFCAYGTRTEATDAFNAPLPDSEVTL